MTALEQSNEDAREIAQILVAALADCRMSRDLRERLAAMRERAERLTRNTDFAWIPMTVLECSALQQSNEDARGIAQILAAALADCQMSRDLRECLATVGERAARIARNTEASRGIQANSETTPVDAPVMIPTVHLNGTAGEVLRHQYRTAVEALRRAIDAMGEAGPNARDYYVQGPDAGLAAQRAHETRIASLKRLREDLAKITAGIERQLEHA
jgi:hypothetical protein